MPLPWDTELAGRIDELTIDSELLRDNPLGDPHQRPLWVYTPPGYDDEPDRRYPAVYVLQGYTGHVAMWRNRTPYRQPFPETADALFAAGDAPPCIVVYVDAWTAYGGSQFVDSPGTGRYHSYLCDEVVPFVDERYRTKAAAAHRGVSGKSSGGFGAMITPMLRPDLFGGLATHAGDSLYEYCYLGEFAKAARTLRDDYEGSYERFWADFGSRPAFTKDSDGGLVMTYGCSAAFSADDDGTVQLPFDVETGALVPDRWQRWLDWDPVRMVPQYADALRGLTAIYIDAGKRDDWYLDLGAAAFRSELAKIGVTDVFFELFDATHMGIDYRYPIGLRYLAERLQ
ncbi:MAG TPA: alpha/beta hydrolase-fold protein [Mycobacteriales bacterium]|nr:alpha/beta hydrolase-fold protein [Mycobacteriales bacterium]